MHHTCALTAFILSLTQTVDLIKGGCLITAEHMRPPLAPYYRARTLYAKCSLRQIQRDAILRNTDSKVTTVLQRSSRLSDVQLLLSLLGDAEAMTCSSTGAGSVHFDLGVTFDDRCRGCHRHRIIGRVAVVESYCTMTAPERRKSNHAANFILCRLMDVRRLILFGTLPTTVMDHRPWTPSKDLQQLLLSDTYEDR